MQGLLNIMVAVITDQWQVYGESEEDIQAAFFFGELDRSLNMVNSFFVGKEAELEALVQDLQKASEHPYTMEYKGDFQHFRKVYTEVAALQKYAELNKEGEPMVGGPHFFAP